MRGWRVPLALIGTIGLAACLVWGSAGAAGGGSDGPVAWTESGLVRGADSGETTVYHGIPYAAPPVGRLRWRDPRPPDRWTGVRDATRPGPVCAQLSGEIPDGSTAEDCLYLDVTVPDETAARPKPVLVWVHGGGFYMGAGRNYDARRFAARGDVVVVTINYRLGVFGYFGHPGLAGSGTFGLRDQQAALAWVRRNAAAFGGDPGNVTVAGQSAGGVSNCAHLTSPPAAGLFDKAVMQSGSCDLSWQANAEFRGQPADAIYEPLAAVEEHGRQTAADLGCARPDEASTLACLRALPVDTLLDVHQAFIQPAYGTPVLPENPVDALRAGRMHRVPVLSGQNSDEATLATSLYEGDTPMSEETYRAVLADTFGADADAVEAEYPRSAYGSAALAWSAITTDRKWACSQYTTSLRLAEHLPVYHYEYADPDAPPLFPGPPAMPMGAYHSAELWSLFDLGGQPAQLSPEQQVLANQMIDYWASFAATGDPARAGGPRWPGFDPAEGVPYAQRLVPGAGGIGPVDLATEHHCGFWAQHSA